MFVGGEIKQPMAAAQMSIGGLSSTGIALETGGSLALIVAQCSTLAVLAVPVCLFAVYWSVLCFVGLGHFVYFALCLIIRFVSPVFIAFFISFWRQKWLFADYCGSASLPARHRGISIYRSGYLVFSV